MAMQYCSASMNLATWLSVKHNHGKGTLFKVGRYSNVRELLNILVNSISDDASGCLIHQLPERLSQQVDCNISNARQGKEKVGNKPCTFLNWI